MPQPRLIDPAVFYDIVKIRRAVDEATEDSVRATTGISNTALNNSMGRLDPFGGGGGTGPKMSKERIFKIRQKAVRALAKAYALDEVAASVATMQSTSSLEEVALHVLRRDKTDIDARYVHFFHEKIPSRQMEHYTPLEPLTDVIMSFPWEMQGAPLRTRALVQIFKGEYEGAVSDLTLGLRIAQELKLRHKPGADQLVLAKHFKEEQEKWNKYGKDWRQVPQLKEEDQPSSLEQQMLFNRAGVYLTIACQHVHAALDGLKEYQQKSKPQENGEAKIESPTISSEEKHAHHERLEARKKVKTYAKRALKDYLGFLEHFDYTPGLPIEITEEIMRRVYDLANGNRQQTPLPRNRMIETNGQVSSGDSSPDRDAVIKHQNTFHQSDSGVEWDSDGWPRLPKPEIHRVSALFAAAPLPDLPNLPDTDVTSAQDSKSRGSTRETVTYHPLLTDALHSLLLAHSLLQTSPTELLRHAHNAARLARIADGYPIFQAARSPARADWIEVLRRANNWIGLSQPWQKLCQPAPLMGHSSGDSETSSTMSRETKGDVVALKKKAADTETEEQKRERRKQEAILDALADERVVDEDSFQRAVRAREKRAIEDEEGLSGPLNDKVTLDPHAPTSKSSAEQRNGGRQSNGSSTKAPFAKRWAQDDGKEYPISTERAEAIARWIRDAPLSMGIKKKKPTKKKARPAPGAALDFRGPAIEEDEVD